MSEQDSRWARTKLHRSFLNIRNWAASPTLPRPANDDGKAWEAYWMAQEQTWRTEPEIDDVRQEYLAKRRSITPDIKKGIYPFKNIKLSRADVEWLLATHENGRGPIDWSDESQRQRRGLDLCGADLREADLSRLPLAGMNNMSDIAAFSTDEEMEAAAVLMQGAILAEAGLEGANLTCAHLEGAYLGVARLESAGLSGARLMGAYLNGVEFEGAYLAGASFVGANLTSAHFVGALLLGTHLEGADLYYAHLERANLRDAHLAGANLSSVFFDTETILNDIHLNNEKDGAVSVADIHWGDVNVAVADWTTISKLGDELKAMQPFLNKIPKDEHMRIDGYSAAVRAYRQLAVVLRNQGLNDEANRFVYRAQLVQRIVYRLQKKSRQYLGSLFLDLLTGYGYKPIRSFIAYLIVILSFAIAYFIVGHTVGPALSPLGAFVFSMTSFHGRGFFPGGITLDDPLTVLAAFEAFVGLLIEVTFIATLTQRLFGK